MPRLACATSGGRLASVRREPEIGQEEWFEMNKVFLVGRLTRDPELRTLPSGKPVANFVVATNEFRGNGAPERTEYHNLVAWDRLAEICGQFLSKGQLVDIAGRR